MLDQSTILRTETARDLPLAAAHEGVSVADFSLRILKEHLEPPSEGLLEAPTQALRLADHPGALIAVSPQDIGRVWTANNLDAVVLAANRRVAGAPFEPAMLRRACEVGKHQLWVATDEKLIPAGMAVTSIFVEPDRAKVLTWVLVTGRGFPGWRWCREYIENWARDQGCKRARAYGRPGWARTGLSDYVARGIIFERML